MEERFDDLVGEQLQIMNRLLSLQGEIGRLEQELLEKKRDFLYIQQLFEQKTEEVIASFEKEVRMEI